MTTLASETTEQWATRMVLRDYRSYRTHSRKDPYYAAVDVLDGYARHLADIVADGGEHLDLAKARYIAARRMKGEVDRRAAVGDGRSFDELTICEQFWNTGRVQAAS